MRSIAIALQAEMMKLRRSKIVWITVGVFMFMPLMMGLMQYVALHPDSSAKAGMFTMKAQMFGANDWKGFLGVLIQAGAGLGMVGFGFVFAYVFGREFTDHTMKDMVALPVSRTSIVLAKYLVSAAWCLTLALLLLVIGLLAGMLVGVAGDKSELLSMSGFYLLQAVLTILITLPVAYIASASRGIIAAVGFCIGLMILANLVATIGLGPYFPWAVPGLVGMNVSGPGMEVGITGYLLTIMTIIAGFWLTIRHWNKADQI